MKVKFMHFWKQEGNSPAISCTYIIRSRVPAPMIDSKSNSCNKQLCVTRSSGNNFKHSIVDKDYNKQFYFSRFTTWHAFNNRDVAAILWGC
ncbi:hypothetical protein FRX31_004186 [Thalictrum thalictroides]|uniref:Uncharacterized protein n=1 Tax=Thalictrum thalictroides TaxID=46969 RepID=A0A7J6X8V1_THATH|nr:hypothetical protein FRX31_004186 [Thalictrum thalictroides]